VRGGGRGPRQRPACPLTLCSGAQQCSMFTGSNKIVKPAGQQPDAFEQQVAQELFNLEVRERAHDHRSAGLRRRRRPPGARGALFRGPDL